MTNEIEEAKKAWADLHRKQFELARQKTRTEPQIKHGGNGFHAQGKKVWKHEFEQLVNPVEAYQSALRSAIEAEMNSQDEERKSWQKANDKSLAHNCAVRVTTLMGILELLDTITPKK